MKINVLLAPNSADELYFTGKTSVVIDVLRATSVIIEAIQNGAREVIPVNSVEFAMKSTANSFGGHTLLGGERNTKKIDGFNLGNSPSEYSQEVVSGKSIVLYTTNGSKAVVKAKFSENLFICAFSNLTSVAQKVVSLGKDLEILCSGKVNTFCIEDTICAGKLISEIEKIIPDIELTDSAKASLVLSKSYGKSVAKILAECEHGKTLVENGFKEDIDFCAKMNTSEIVPVFHSGSIKLQKPVPVTVNAVKADGDEIKQ
jgi:2-phosphosulfolactate phosphatase